MNKTERDGLISLMKRRAKVASADADARAAEMLSEFEAQMDTRYAYDDDAVWSQAAEAAMAAVTEAQRVIHERCRELGIPDQCAPGLTVGWYGRGRNAAVGERAEMRRVAKSKIEAIRVGAVAAIHKAAVEYETVLISGMLQSDAARMALEQMPRISALMPRLDAEAIVLLTSAKRRRVPEAIGTDGYGP